MFFIASFLVSSSHETSVKENCCFFWGVGGYRRISPINEGTTFPGTVDGVRTRTYYSVPTKPLKVITYRSNFGAVKGVTLFCNLFCHSVLTLRSREGVVLRCVHVFFSLRGRIASAQHVKITPPQRHALRPGPHR